ncbi:hypothetical protein ATY41_00885 [Leifsonia xyli subsp. xyli]|uniref:Uncharacterized protein n=2 Tax=Leifsonia xyli subsp. xyli TaxID=59736 RepID=Q6ADD3_LEIXX|nr:hypothetical protein [Leifsonia xyli]AAT89611.1 hypothetical protein Lxx18800 [Leifsonia xyli subsp. xyli str. CTCB07]ODA91281.1 hypothetical protein ATY41_00885 [Leifsonia xyli subsp. xyli]
MLAGCSAPAPAEDPGAPKRGSVPAATAEYVSCLNDEGIDAIVDQDGRVAYGIGEAYGGASVSSDDSPGDARAQAERICAERVPAYTAPDDER